jgi:hypothetical protein
MSISLSLSSSASESSISVSALTTSALLIFPLRFLVATVGSASSSSASSSVSVSTVSLLFTLRPPFERTLYIFSAGCTRFGRPVGCGGGASRLPMLSLTIRLLGAVSGTPSFELELGGLVVACMLGSLRVYVC